MKKVLSLFILVILVLLIGCTSYLGPLPFKTNVYFFNNSGRDIEIKYITVDSKKYYNVACSHNKGEENINISSNIDLEQYMDPDFYNIQNKDIKIISIKNGEQSEKGFLLSGFKYQKEQEKVVGFLKEERKKVYVFVYINGKVESLNLLVGEVYACSRYAHDGYFNFLSKDFTLKEYYMEGDVKRVTNPENFIFTLNDNIWEGH